MTKSILVRLMALVKGRIHDGLDAVEDPGSLARQKLRELAGLIARNETVLQELRTEQRLMQNKRKDAQASIEQWSHFAKQAVVQGRDDYAQKALRNVDCAEVEMAFLDKALESLEPKVSALSAQLEQLRDSQETAQRQVAMLDVRAKAAQASKQASQVLREFTIQADGAVSLSELEESVERMEIRAEVEQEFAPQNGELCVDLAKVRVQARLEKLKADVIGSNTAGV